jgi:hypothetical protein
MTTRGGSVQKGADTVLEKELPRNGNLDDSAHDVNLLDNVIDTDTNEVANQTGIE